MMVMVRAMVFISKMMNLNTDFRKELGHSMSISMDTTASQVQVQAKENANASASTKAKAEEEVENQWKAQVEAQTNVSAIKDTNISANNHQTQHQQMAYLHHWQHD